MFRDFVSIAPNDVLPRGRGSALVLKVYSDRGAKQDSGVMCVASAAFWPFFDDQFLHEWEPILAGWNAKAFHATDFYPGAGEFKRKLKDGTPIPERMALFEKDSRIVPAVIAKYVRQLFVASFRIDEFERIAPLSWRQHFGSLHTVAAQIAVGAVGHWANRVGHDGDIAYFYEAGDEDEAEVNAAFRRVYDNRILRAHSRMASTPLGIPKGQARGLEVADFLAWHWNKWFTDRFLPNSNRRPMRKDIQSVMDALSERGEKIDVRLVTGTALEDLLIANGCTRTVRASESPADVAVQPQAQLREQHGTGNGE